MTLDRSQWAICTGKRALCHLPLHTIIGLSSEGRGPWISNFCYKWRAFRKIIYRYVEKLKIDLDGWVNYYNNDRTPMQNVLRAHSYGNIDSASPKTAFSGQRPQPAAKAEQPLWKRQLATGRSDDLTTIPYCCYE